MSIRQGDAMRDTLQKLCFNATIIFAFCLALNAGAFAATATPERDAVLMSPVSAVISPAGARLTFTEVARVEKREKDSRVIITIPDDATNLNISVPGRTIIRWSAVPVILKTSSERMTIREELVEKRDDLAANLETAKARIEVLKSQTQPANSQELANRQSLMQQQMPRLIEERANLERELSQVQRELAGMPAASGVGQSIEIVLLNDSRDEEKTKVDYSYDIGSCGWTPVYNFSANPDSDKSDLVYARLLAEIWQYTGLDWTDTEIVLASRGEGPREPRPLREWRVDSGQEKPAVHETATVARAMKAAPATMALHNDAAGVPASAPVIADADNIYATWKLSTKGLPEGKSRLLISEDTWNAPLQWLCRPTKTDNNIWIMAKYTLPPHKAWPAGIAQYNLEGQNIGEGVFRPSGGEATMYFGADPRMSVNMVVDSDKQGESGFINTSKTWTGAWTFTINNGHSVPIKVRVERPAPILGNDNITVSYKDNPKARINEKEHMIYWIVDAPANGKATIEQGVTISSPVKLPLLPDVP